MLMSSMAAVTESKNEDEDDENDVTAKPIAGAINN